MCSSAYTARRAHPYIPQRWKDVRRLTPHPDPLDGASWWRLALRLALWFRRIATVAESQKIPGSVTPGSQTPGSEIPFAAWLLRAGHRRRSEGKQRLRGQAQS